MNDTDTRYMQRALELAARGLGRTAPNPAVGAVIVRGERVVGEGWHRAAGQPHAEVEALRVAGELARGATVYVTLEPCSHYGRTPPCTDALATAGVARVVYAAQDCDFRCAGKAEELLRAAGVEVQDGVLEAEARCLNEAYFKHKETGLPFVTLKLALTLDGRMATRSYESRWITSEEARRRVHQMRDQADALLVGAGTVAHDNPALTVRLGGRPEERQPLRVILAPRGIPEDSRLLRPPGHALVVVDRLGPAGAEASSRPREHNGKWEYLALGTRQGRFDLAEVLQALGERDVMGVLAEGGAHVAGSLLAAGLVDRLVLFYAPRLLLDELAVGPSEEGRAVPHLADTCNFRLEATERVGPDLMVTLYPCSPD